MIHKYFLYCKFNKQDSLIISGGIFAVLALILWGCIGIFSEVELDASNVLTKGRVRSVRSYYYIIKSATIEYEINEEKTSGSVDYFFLDNNLKIGEIIPIRVSARKNWVFSLDQEIGNRIIPQLFKIFLGLIFGVFFISAYSRKIDKYFLDNYK